MRSVLFPALLGLLGSISIAQTQEPAASTIVPPKMIPGAAYAPPPYPIESRATGEEGVVKLRLRVLEDGSVSEAQIAASSGYPRLDEAAAANAVSWRFQPATLEGVPTAAWHDFRMKFSLGSQKVVPGVPAKAPKPKYPRESYRKGEEGKVTLQLLVLADGKIGHARVLISSGFTKLDEAAREAAMHWLFKPATVEGKPVDNWQPFKVDFRLNDGEPFFPAIPDRPAFPDFPSRD